jgi:hypothetical protein
MSLLADHPDVRFNFYRSASMSFAEFAGHKAGPLQSFSCESIFVNYITIKMPMM